MIITNNVKYFPHTILQLDSKKVPFVTRELLDDILKNQSLNPGIKRNDYYIINTGAELRGYSEHTKEFQTFEHFINLARFKGYSLVMIKF